MRLAHLHVGLYHNYVGDIGVQELLKPLTHLIGLAHLDVDLRESKAGSVSVQELLKPLAHLTNLKEPIIEL